MYPIRAFKISRLLKQARELAQELRIIEDDMDISWWKQPTELEEPLREAAALAQGSPRLMARVFDAAVRLMDEPTLTPSNEAKLAEIARSLIRSDYDRERLSDRIRLDPDGLSSSLPEHFGNPAFVQMKKTAGAILDAVGQSTDRGLYQSLLIQFAGMGSETKNWKARPLVETVLKHMHEPEEMIAVFKAQPQFADTVTRLIHDPKTYTQLHDRLTAVQDAWPELTPARLIIAKALFEKTPLPHEQQNGLFADVTRAAEQDPVYGAHLVAQTLGKAIFAVRQNRGDIAQNLIELANRVSGSPLARFSVLASRELCFWGSEHEGKTVRSFIKTRMDISASAPAQQFPARALMIVHNNQKREPDALLDLLLTPPRKLRDAEFYLAHHTRMAYDTLGKGQPLLRAWAALCMESPVGNKEIAAVLEAKNAQLHVPAARSLSQLI